MKKTKRVLSLLLVFIFMLSVIAGCGTSQENDNQNTAEDTTTAEVKTTQGETTETTTEGTADNSMEALYEEVKNLSGQAAVDFFKSLKDRGLTSEQIMQFFIDIPLSQANKQIAELYENDGFENYAKTYPVGEAYGDYVWKPGMGATFKGHFSGWDLKAAFSDYMSLPEGPVGDADKTYKIGVCCAGMKVAWSTNLHDSLMFEVNRHPNVSVDIQDGEYDNNKTSNIIDTFISQGVDGILLWPAVEAPTGPPVQRAEEAGIPVCTIDRISGYPQTSIRVAGNFPANGAQDAMYLVDQLDKEGDFNCNLVLLRKPLGSTADAIRTGFFLKVLSYIPEIKILGSYHDTTDRAVAFTNSQAAIQAHPVIDAVFVNGDHQAIVMLEALNLAGRLDSRKDGKRVIITCVDDSKEAINNVKDGKFACCTPYTPIIADIGLRALLLKITGTDLPQDIHLPNIPIVTQNGDPIFGMDTLTPDEWYEYTFGPEV